MDSQKEFDLRRKLEKVEGGIYDIYSIKDAIEEVRSMVIALNSDVENNVYSANNVFSKIQEVVNKPELQDASWTNDPFYQVVKDYELYVSYLLESSVYKSWIINFYNVLVNKLIKLLENFKEEWTNLKKVELEKERLEREIAELKNDQSQKEKDEILNRLFDFVKESKNNQGVVNPQITQMLKSQEELISSLKKEIEELKTNKSMLKKEQVPKVTEYEKLSNQDKSVLDSVMKVPPPLSQEETTDDEEEVVDDSDASDDSDNVFISDEEVEKKILAELGELTGAEPVKNVDAYKIMLESPEEIREVVGEDFNTNNVGDALISLNEKFNNYLYSKKALAGFLGVKQSKLKDLLKQFKCKKLEVI